MGDDVRKGANTREEDKGAANSFEIVNWIKISKSYSWEGSQRIIKANNALKHCFSSFIYSLQLMIKIFVVQKCFLVIWLSLNKVVISKIYAYIPKYAEIIRSYKDGEDFFEKSVEVGGIYHILNFYVINWRIILYILIR